MDTHWANQAFQAANAIGLSYPDDSSAPVNVSAGQISGACSIEISPRYRINARHPEHVAVGITFVRKKNIRLAQSTGHDCSGSTFGIVVKTTIKAYPSTPVSAMKLSIAPLHATGMPAFMDALSRVYTAYPGPSGKGSVVMEAGPSPLLRR